MTILDDIFWTIIFWFQCKKFLSSNIAKLSLNIVKYHSTQMSKVFDKYRQILSRFMLYSIEFQMISKDAASKGKLQNKCSESFQFKNIVD